NLKNQERIGAQTMHYKLLKYAERGDIEKEDISKSTTIKNWLYLYARAFKQEATENKLELEIK
ncbi:1297_t:CDS:1, partial [Racocetra persica]